MRTTTQIKRKIRNLEKEPINFENVHKFIWAEALRWVLNGQVKQEVTC